MTSLVETTMGTAVAQIPQAFELIESTTTDAAIEMLKQDLLPLTIAGIDDKSGYEAVRKGIATTRGLRGRVEARREELKRPAIDYGKALEAEANRIKNSLLEIENVLKDRKKVIDDEKERLRKEEQDRLDAIRQAEIIKQREEAEAKAREAEAKAREEAEARAKSEAEVQALREQVEAMQRQLAAAEEARKRQEHEAAEAKERMEREAMEAKLAADRAEAKAREQAESAARKEKEERERAILAEQQRIAREKAEKERAEKERKEREAAEIAKAQREKELAPDREIMAKFAIGLVEYVDSFDTNGVKDNQANGMLESSIFGIKAICDKILLW